MGKTKIERKYGPEHKTCETTVDVPTVRVERMPYMHIDDGMPHSDSREGVYIQWFGETSKPLPENVEIPGGSQFLFSVLADPDDLQFYLYPKRFRVIWLDQVKNWPNPKAIQAMIDGPGEGNPDKWMVWLISSHITIEYGNGRSGPATPIFEIAMLGDPNCGVIIPRRHYNDSVRLEELKKCQ